MNQELFFFIGTEAELIKLFPIMVCLQNQNAPCRIISSGQNDIGNSPVLKTLKNKTVDLTLSSESDIRKSAFGLLHWFVKTAMTQGAKIRPIFRDTDMHHSVMVVHGDTVSTMMGAKLGKKLGMTVAHVEAGLRSHNWLSPFPEEIDRVVTSKMARYHFAPGQVAIGNLKAAKGVVVDTVYNTITDSLTYARTVACSDRRILELQQSDYFVFVLHRQENLAQKALVQKLLVSVAKQAKRMRCVMILHKPTEVALSNMGLMDAIRNNPDITILPRVDYFDFMKLLGNAQFVITDGGSNQEELSYMGKPCLILRKHTERQDGLGRNALLYGGDVNTLDGFAQHYADYRHEPVIPTFSPSELIATTLINMIAGR